MRGFFSRLFLQSRFLAVALLATASLALPGRLQGLDVARHTYLLQGEGEPTYIYNVAQEDADYDMLTVRVSRNTIGDAQLIPTPGRSLTVHTAEGDVLLVAEGETVDHLLRRLELQPAEDQMVVLDMTGSMLKVSVEDEWQYSWTRTVPTGHDTEQVENPFLPQGTTQVAQAGQDGAYVETFVNTYVQTGLKDTSFAGRTDDNAVTEIVEIGTAVDSVAYGDYILEDHPNENGDGGYLLFASGVTLPYQKLLTGFEATAYDIHGTTATGYPTAMGNVAVDPTVIPYGTRMFIQSYTGAFVYGMAVARDCGGGIKGNIIDLWFPDHETCIQWGRRDIVVYILG